MRHLILAATVGREKIHCWFRQGIRLRLGLTVVERIFADDMLMILKEKNFLIEVICVFSYVITLSSLYCFILLCRAEPVLHR